MSVILAVVTLWISQSLAQTVVNPGPCADPPCEYFGDELICNNKDACKDITFTCDSEEECDVKCQAEAACNGATINGNGASKLTVHCTKENSCAEITVNGQTVTGNTIYNCDGSYTCPGAQTRFFCGEGACTAMCFGTDNPCTGTKFFGCDSANFVCVIPNLCEDADLIDGCGEPEPIFAKSALVANIDNHAAEPAPATVNEITDPGECLTMEPCEYTGTKLRCTQNQICKRLTFNCMDGEKCDVYCEGPQSCEDAVINGNQASSLTVMCGAGKGACEAIKVNGENVSGATMLNCHAEDGCQGSETHFVCSKTGKCSVGCNGNSNVCQGARFYKCQDPPNFMCNPKENCEEATTSDGCDPNIISPAAKRSRLLLL